MRYPSRRVVVYSLISLVSVALGVDFALSVAGSNDSTPMDPARIEYIRNRPPHRCLDLHPGDGAVIHADGRVVIRLYRDAELVAECRPGTATSHCASAHGVLRLEWTFDRAAERGYYRWLTFRAAVLPSEGPFLDDLLAAREVGAYAEHGEIPVRQ
jgi:hypothetical protein